MTMLKRLEWVLSSRLWSLIAKEINQILRDKQLLFLLVFPPTVQLIVFGFALDPQVTHINLGVVDHAHTIESRELVATFTANDVFVANQYFLDQNELTEQVQLGKLTAGLVIPPDFDRDLAQGDRATVQVVIDGVDANTAGIARGYVTQIVRRFSQSLETQPSPPLVESQSIFFFNPGLLSSWFFAPGVIGAAITLTGVLVSSTTVIREKDSGTLEQLLMTPADSWEIALAKIIPLFGVLMGVVVLALSISRIVFDLPIEGNLLLYLALSGLYVFVTIGFGMMLATLAKSQQQVILSAFFINLPLIILSGAISPIESMPTVFQYISLFNPLRHFIEISRGLLLRGAGLDILWVNAGALAVMATLLLTVSVIQFRKQLK